MGDEFDVLSRTTNADAERQAISRWGLDFARRYRLRRVAVKKVRLDHSPKGGRRLQAAIVHELIEFGTRWRQAETH
jgi:hypothetical protein